MVHCYGSGTLNFVSFYRNFGVLRQNVRRKTRLFLDKRSVIKHCKQELSEEETRFSLKMPSGKGIIRGPDASINNYSFSGLKLKEDFIKKLAVAGIVDPTQIQV